MPDHATFDDVCIAAPVVRSAETSCHARRMRRVWLKAATPVVAVAKRLKWHGDVAGTCWGPTPAVLGPATPVVAIAKGLWCHADVTGTCWGPTTPLLGPATSVVAIAKRP
jgi:hypothetical protein